MRGVIGRAGAGAGREALAGLRCGWISIRPFHPFRGLESVGFTIARVCDLSEGFRAGMGKERIGKERKGKRGPALGFMNRSRYRTCSASGQYLYSNRTSISSGRNTVRVNLSCFERTAPIYIRGA